MSSNYMFSPQSRIHRWTDNYAEEMMGFLDLLLLMPHIKNHVLNDYSKITLTSITNLGKYMVRDRFLILFRFLHFADNENPTPTD